MEAPELASGVLLRVAYDGRNYSGFTRQAGRATIASELGAAIRQIDPCASEVRCSSRTDAGVHALAQPVAFDTHKQINSRGWVLAINQHLPDSIRVVSAARVPRGYSPVPVARWKRYRYLVLLSPTRDPFWHGRAWHVYQRLNQVAMSDAAKLIQGERDFAAYRSASDQRTNTVRHLSKVAVQGSARDPRLLEILVEGSAFLHNMVRIISGSLVDVGRARLDAAALTRAFHSKNRADLGMTAPACGLYLEHVALDDAATELWPTD
jgi:tRNA pseudouridine38-40 synthase